ncbi:hypothetical protein ACVWXU_001505 [Streptomyces sp. TE33382]
MSIGAPIGTRPGTACAPDIENRVEQVVVSVGPYKALTVRPG